jgi:hypothetical protein
MSNQLPTIDPAALAQVSGGTTVATNTGSTSTSNNDQILTTLNTILNSIQSLSQHQNSGGLNQTEMLMLLMIMGQRNQVAVGPSPSPWGWGQPPVYYY